MDSKTVVEWILVAVVLLGLAKEGCSSDAQHQLTAAEARQPRFGPWLLSNVLMRRIQPEKNDASSENGVKSDDSSTTSSGNIRNGRLLPTWLLTYQSLSAFEQQLRTNSSRFQNA